MTHHLDNGLFLSNPAYVRSQAFTHLETRPKGNGRDRGWIRLLAGVYLILVLVGAVLGSSLWTPTQVQLAEEVPATGSVR